MIPAVVRQSQCLIKGNFFDVFFLIILLRFTLLNNGVSLVGNTILNALLIEFVS